VVNENTSPFNAREEERKLMTDRHLNLFHCYSAHDKEGEPARGGKPIEDNLTRAFIHTIRMLSGDHRKWFLARLFGTDDQLQGCGFASAGVALQNQIPEERDPSKGRFGSKAVRRIVSISTSTRIPERVKTQDEPERERRPDAWIFDSIGYSYCVLVESKCRDNPLDREQIRGHGKWFEWEDEWDKKEDGRWLRKTWYDVLEVIDVALPGLSDARSRPAEAIPRFNDQEEIVLTHLWVFLSYYDYRLFKGFRLGERDTRRQPFNWQLFSFKGRRARK